MLVTAILVAGCVHTPALDTGRSAAIITKVDLPRPSGLQMINPVIVPINTSTHPIGNWTRYPPPLSSGVRGSWALRRRAVSARLTPGKTRWNLVFGLQPTTSRYGRSDGVDLYYMENGQQYHLRTGIRLVVTTDNKSCI
jgi:hypothetical protein